jgi:hypothetical protein
MANVLKLRLMMRPRDVTINSKECTCSPCEHLHIQMAEQGPITFRKGTAWCGLFGEDLAWPKTVGDIERFPMCRQLDGSPDGTLVTLTSRGMQISR